MGGVWKHRLSNVDLEAATAVCAIDGPVEILISGKYRRCSVAIGTNYSPRKPKPGEHRMLSKDAETMTGVCGMCGPVSVVLRRGSLRCEFSKLRPEQLRMKQELKAAIRDGKPCEICGVVGGNMTLDHRHGEKTWRGVLCNKHNTGLGMFDDDPALLIAAAKYLQQYNDK